jgi:hypothetical protein
MQYNRVRQPVTGGKMRTKAIRVYADTSVFGGVFDEEFARGSGLFFQQVDEGRFSLVVSDLVDQEARRAPERVQEYFSRWVARAEMCEITPKAVRLRRAYIQAGIVTENSLADATHVAAATVARCSFIVSWNFHHIVHVDKIPFYNAVNTLQGYSPIRINSPLEVVKYEEEDV